MYARIALRTLTPVPAKPECFTVGGYTANTSDGKEFSFDWDEMTGYTTIGEDGKATIECLLGDWSSVFDSTNADQGVSPEMLTAKFVTQCELVEFQYECYQVPEDEVSGDYLPMEIVSFTIFDNEGEFSFPAEVLAAANERVRKIEAQ